MSLSRTAVAAAIFLFTAGCGSSSSGQFSTEVAFPNLSFTRPVDIQDPRDGTSRLFVVEQAGVIRVFANSEDVAMSTVFLDIQLRVDDTGNEEGLLGLAFHPEYANNGYFFVNYTASDPDRTVISRFSVTANPNVADSNSEEVILTVAQPYGNHNGGQIAFGPDGMLYIGMGDGGSGGDPQGHGQNRQTLLGAMLRIDVNSASGNAPYSIPVDNPFVGNEQGFREEIFAYGLRNPWRFSFDSETGDLWTGDVGQRRFEEIDIVESGKNYGWNIMEASECYNSATCDTTGLEFPVHAYAHNSGNASVTGGHVYRGLRLPGLRGAYVFADFSSGRIWGLEKSGSSYNHTLLFDAPYNISAFGTDSDDELFICGFDGRIHRIAENSPTPTEDPMGSLDAKPIEAYPNPFSDFAKVAFAMASPGQVDVTVYDVLGREVLKLLNAYREAGSHELVWNGMRDDRTRASSGIYYIRIRQQGSVSVSSVAYQPHR